MSTRKKLYRLSSAIFALCASAIMTAPASAQAVHRKGVTLAGSLDYYVANNFAELQRILDTGVGVVGINMAWFEATIVPNSSPTTAARPVNARLWNDPVYENSRLLKNIDLVTDYVQRNGNGAFVMMITFGTPGWALCPGDPASDPASFQYPPANAADYGDFMYAMSERYNGNHVSASGVTIGKARDWVVYNEVNSPSWWRNTACNTANYDPVYYYGGILNAAYTEVHHVPDTRVLAGAFTSYDHVDYTGTAGTRISTSYSDWNTSTRNSGMDHAWISPLDFIDKMKYYNLRFDAVSVHPYAPRIYASPLEAPPAGAITLANLDLLLQKMRDLYPADSGKWHIVLGEYFQHSYYGSRVASSAADDQGPGIGCPNYFCASTSEGNLKAYLQEAYGTSGSDKSYLDYLMWSMWNNIDGYTGGLVRRDGTNKTEGTVGGSVRQAFTDIAP